MRPVIIRKNPTHCSGSEKTSPNRIYANNDSKIKKSIFY